MAGAFKKTMISLGLADGDDYSDESFSNEQKSAPRSSESAPEARSSAPAPAERQPSARSSAPAVTAQQATGAVPTATESSAVVPLNTGEQAGASSVQQYNSSNLAVDPDYRAPVTPIKRAPSSRDESSEMRKITTVHPRSYNDAKVIGESFRDNIPVIMNVTEMGEAEAKRLVDFSAGLVFGLGGSIERVTNKVFLLTPKNVEVLAEERAAAEAPSSAQFFNQS